MSQPFEQLAELDKLVHEPARLALLTGLMACESADFLFLQRLTGLTKGNLSAHVSKLEGAGLVYVSKAFVGKMPQTTIGLTPTGRTAVERHWEQLESLRRQTARWRPGRAAETRGVRGDGEALPEEAVKPPAGDALGRGWTER